MVQAVMHALRAHDRGVAGLCYEQMPVPSPGIGDVLVRVAGASFTPTELDWPSTWVDRAGRERTPAVPGHEVSGTVAAMGYGTTGLAVGDEVFGLTDWYRDGALAEYVAVEARNLARKPASIPAAEAAAVPMAALTAWQALFSHGGLRGGQTVVIAGAGGGVGSFAIQLARDAGARVVGIGRERARELILDLGADQFVEADSSELGQVGEADVVFDLAGGDLVKRYWSMVRRGGVIVSVVAPIGGDGPGQQREDEIRTVFFVVEPDRAQLDEVAGRIGTGQLRPVVGQVTELADGPRAFAVKQAGGVPGKVVLRPSPR
ncbi:MAG TPA: NADP-dependent oxidoreductase [Streptosporangiaceae bacterium]|nr:NADP-dependent oxidoreductase [Streptosporangiaceae bacterium]